MSRQLTGTLSAPDGSALPNVTVFVVALRTEETSQVVRGSSHNFTTDSGGSYNETLSNGYYRIARQTDGATLHVGTIFIEDGPSTTLTDLLALNEAPPAPGELIVVQQVALAEQAAADAAAALNAANALFSGAPPVIVTHPQGVSVNEGAGVLMSSSAFNYTSVQWYRNGQIIAGATSTIYAFLAAEVNDGDIFYARFTNPAGNIDSVHATLLVNAAPSVQNQTVSAIVGVGVFVNLGPAQDSEGEPVTYTVLPSDNFTQTGNTLIYTAPGAGTEQLSVSATDGSATVAATVDIVAAVSDAQANSLTFDNIVVS